MDLCPTQMQYNEYMYHPKVAVTVQKLLEQLREQPLELQTDVSTAEDLTPAEWARYRDNAMKSIMASMVDYIYYCDCRAAAIKKFEETHYTDQSTGLTYRVADLVEKAEDSPVYVENLDKLHPKSAVWNVPTIKDFVYHAKRVWSLSGNSDKALEPVIVDLNGYVIDGWHRIALALIEGRTTVECRMISEFPTPVNKDDEYVVDAM